MFTTGAGTDLEFTAVGVGKADSDKLVELGEIHEVTLIDLDGAASASTTTGLGTSLKTGDKFSLQVIPPRGATIDIERTFPAVLETYNDIN